MASQDAEALEAAWTIHAAQVDWTGKVDTKASFALALESALLAGVIGLSGDDNLLSGLSGGLLLLYYCGGVLLGLSAVFAMLVVFPQLRRRHLKKEAGAGAHVYFGHVRHHTPDELKALIAAGSRSTLGEVCAQIVRMAEIAWRKHVFLQVSLASALAGALALAIAGVLPAIT